MKTKTYVKFYEYKPSGLIGEGLGSDSVFILDGRNSKEIMIADSIERIYRLRAVQKYCAYEIRCGDFTNYNVIFRSATLKLKGEILQNNGI